MNGILPRILLAIALALIAVDVLWVSAAHIQINYLAYMKIGGISAAVALGGIFYTRVRRDEKIAAMLFGASFMIAFSNAASVFNYLLLRIAGQRIDGFLAQIDRAMGVDWPSMIVWASHHRALDVTLMLIYGCVLPEVAMVIVLLGWRSSPARIYSFCLSIVVATAIAMGFWAVFPSFGAITVYALPPDLVAHTPLSLDPKYGHDLLKLLANGPGYITPTDLKGLIGFPSFHAVLALLVTWYLREVKYVRWPVAILNLTVLISTPIQGGHHVIDVVAGVGVTVLAVIAAEKLTALAARGRIAAFSPVFSGANTPV